jgi:hypothetical protein
MRTLETDVQVGADGSLKLLAPLPSWLKPGRRHLVLVVEDPAPTAPARRRSAMDALREIARKGGLGIPDPTAWQRAERRDRHLPGRA